MGETVQKRSVRYTILYLMIALAGCAPKKPEGQVVAVINGEEVTRRELASEPQAAGLPDGPGAQAAMNKLLGGVIDRKLAVAKAQELGLDHTPEYLAQSKRLNEVLLSRALFERWAREAPDPSGAAVQAYVAANPQQFDGRKLVLADRIQTDADGIDPKALEPLATNDDIAEYLRLQSRPFRRDRTVIDTAAVPLSLYRQLISAPQGYPVAFEQAGKLIAIAPVEIKDAPTSAADRAEASNAALRQATVSQKLAALRKSAKIALKAGYRLAAEPALPSPASARGAPISE